MGLIAQALLDGLFILKPLLWIWLIFTLIRAISHRAKDAIDKGLEHVVNTAKGGHGGGSEEGRERKRAQVDEEKEERASKKLERLAAYDERLQKHEHNIDDAIQAEEGKEEEDLKRLADLLRQLNATIKEIEAVAKGDRDPAVKEKLESLKEHYKAIMQRVLNEANTLLERLSKEREAIKELHDDAVKEWKIVKKESLNTRILERHRVNLDALKNRQTTDQKKKIEGLEKELDSLIVRDRKATRRERKTLDQAEDNLDAEIKLISGLKKDITKKVEKGVTSKDVPAFYQKVSEAYALLKKREGYQAYKEKLDEYEHKLDESISDIASKISALVEGQQAVTQRQAPEPRR